MPSLLGLLFFVPFCVALSHHHNGDSSVTPSARKLHGRFLHITDIHPDPFYKTHSSTEDIAACHRGTGPAGIYGAETSDCDAPFSLVNATFQWIDENLKDSIDFVIWTGDSARHDNDERHPRNDKQVIDLNEMVAGKFFEVFQKPDHINDTDPTNDLVIPIVPTFGNNDILPHNIFEKGPNRWTLRYLNIWKRFIPEEQRHQFQRGGWFNVEAIPGKLVVFSLNTLYFFDSNSAVDGCAAKSEPGYEQFEWLRVQLEFVRQRGMKAILMGHVPPARTENKKSWDETCWQKYALWTRQYRDIIVGQLFGHMNINHFMLQDFKDIDKKIEKGIAVDDRFDSNTKQDDEEFTVQSATDYLLDLRKSWAKLPTISSLVDENEADTGLWRLIPEVMKKGKKKHRKGGDSDNAKYGKIGGPWGERYSVAHVMSSIVPNYLPTLRVFEYNVTGLETMMAPGKALSPDERTLSAQIPLAAPEPQTERYEDMEASEVDIHKAKEEAFRNKKKTKKHKFTVPNPPTKSSPPGPAYSPQTLSLTGYTHYYANLTYINNDFTDDDEQDVDGNRWKEGKHKGKKPPKHDDKKPQPNEFKFQIEYSTFNDKVFGLKDLTTRHYLDLARRIGDYVGKKASELPMRELKRGFDADEVEDVNDLEEEEEEEEEESDSEEQESNWRQQGKKDKKKKGKGGKKHKKSKEWLAFVRRAFVETVDAKSIQQGVSQAEAVGEGS